MNGYLSAIERVGGGSWGVSIGLCQEFRVNLATGGRNWRPLAKGYSGLVREFSDCILLFSPHCVCVCKSVGGYVVVVYGEIEK